MNTGDWRWELKHETDPGKRLLYTRNNSCVVPRRRAAALHLILRALEGDPGAVINTFADRDVDQGRQSL